MSNHEYQKQVKEIFSRKSSVDGEDPYEQMKRVINGKNMANPLGSDTQEEAMKTKKEKLGELYALYKEGMDSLLKGWAPQAFLEEVLAAEKDLGIDIEESPKRKTPMSEWLDGEDEELDWTNPEFVPTRMKVFDEADYSGGDDE